jgi:hypothetical protein
MKENMPGWMKASIHLSMMVLRKLLIMVNSKKSVFFGDPNSSFMVKYTFGETMDGLYNIPEVIQQDNLGIAAYGKPSQMLTGIT